MAVMHSAAKGDMDRFGVDLVNSDDAAALSLRWAGRKQLTYRRFSASNCNIVDYEYFHLAGEIGENFGVQQAVAGERRGACSMFEFGVLRHHRAALTGRVLNDDLLASAIFCRKYFYSKEHGGNLTRR